MSNIDHFFGYAYFVYVFNFEVWCQRLRRYIRDLVHFRMTENNGQVKAGTETRNRVAPQLCTHHSPVTHPPIFSAHHPILSASQRSKKLSPLSHHERFACYENFTHMWTDLPPIWVCSAEASLNQLVHPRNAQNQCAQEYWASQAHMCFCLFTDNNLHKKIPYSWRAGRYHGGGE